MPIPIRVILVDDHGLIRAGLRRVLEAVPDFEVVGEAGDAAAALAVASDKQPDVVLMDISLPGMSGIEATSRLVAAHPRARVLVVSMHTHAEYVRAALAAGAGGYLAKSAGSEELVAAIRTVARGERYLGRDVEALLPGGPDRTASPTGLTPRQREVLLLMVQGFGTRAIAGKLSLSVKTIETHRARLMTRLGIRDVPGLVLFAVRNGLVPPDA
jgi:DNA-binding NarL/FixJ family response regulator